MTTHSHPELNNRARHILKVLVESYIQDGQPVGSRNLARASGLDLSAATIRNVMADLEEMGYIRAPHTSAGRVPTSQGYRLFVDALVNIKPLEQQALHILEGQLKAERDPGSLIQSASSLLSGITQLTGVVSMPRRNPSAIRQIEFMRLSERQVLAILVMNRNEVQNRIIQLDSDVSSSDLQQAANFLNERLIGKDLQQARTTLLEEMRQHREDMNRMMLSAIELGEKTVADLDDRQDEDYVIAGETNLMGYDDLSDIHKLRELFAAFTRKRDILSLLDKCLQAEGVKIFIGRESGQSVFEECSLVTAPYMVDGEQIGVLGVIGPKRMPYERVIPVVDITARLLSVALNSKIS
ncbi:heat-inducible transcriptional repressor HrcA [Thiothrix nivea]|uniref:Heat-inducible transcription repressor HrcA n=1 Tax=Thiothrix nivea (strain ATCC 35100 / DSM 5205 / JP2) TaxID=870187 RepID=A0A656HJN8_THINJ|nr:heat-inducible transcriptional repressor HrcA [Thiothrix nivea]EIJ36677.1 heat-inducible transcription repressor HrcA [Thiothrix nivea DSM 5205]